MNREAANKLSDSRVLLVDVGNTHLKWAWSEQLGSEPFQIVAYRSLPLHDLPGLCWTHLHRPQRVLIANVAGSLIEDTLSRWMDNRWGVTPDFIRSQKRAWGVVNSYTDPGTLGVDRWLTLVAAQNRQLSPACILDCGTAITLDLIDGEGVHRGGLILPGFQSMRKAVLGSTRIQTGETNPLTGLLAHDTAGAIALGAIQAVVSLVKRVLDESEEEIGQRPGLLLTGGGADYLKAHLDEPWDLKPDLVMSGLSVIAVGQNL